MKNLEDLELNFHGSADYDKSEGDEDEEDECLDSSEQISKEVKAEMKMMFKEVPLANLY